MQVLHTHVHTCTYSHTCTVYVQYTHVMHIVIHVHAGTVYVYCTHVHTYSHTCACTVQLKKTLLKVTGNYLLKFYLKVTSGSCG